MPLWPFGRKKRRTSTSSQAVGDVPEPAPAPATANDQTAVSDARRHMASPTPTPTQTPTRPASSSRRNSQRKRKAADGTGNTTPSKSANAEKPLRKTSVQDITALPGLRELESSPHLRPVNPHRPVIAYNLERGSPARLAVSGATREQAPSAASPHARPSQSGRLQRRVSGRRREQSLRAEEIRTMSAPMQIPKRPAGVNNDLLRRDSKKARRTFSSKQRPDDHRGSNVSLPMSVPSTMSANSDQRGWLVGGIDVLSPRPTVRLSMPGHYPSNGSPAGLSRKDSKKGKLPAIAQQSSRKDRRRIADLADDLDSSDLRAVLERDARRKEQKASEQQDRLERKLRRRAEKQRLEEERLRPATERAPPTAVHPAFRQHGADEDVPVGPLTPTSVRNEGEDTDGHGHDQDNEADESGQDSDQASRGGTYLKYPAGQDIPQNPFDDPSPDLGPFVDTLPEPSPDADRWSPVQTPMDEPVIRTAQAVRLSQGRMSPPTSPPLSPLAKPDASGSLSELSDLQAQRTTSISRPFAQDQRRASDSSGRRTGTWASIFRRGPSTSHTSLDHGGKGSPSESSFANVSRESMSRQAIPAHLIAQSSRRAGTPVRTQSRFREDLPDAPMSPPDSRVQSPELTIAAANVAAARRANRSLQQSDPAPTQHDIPEETGRMARTDSPVVLEEPESEFPISQSLASIDSEGSWMSGRPVQRKSTQRLQRDSAASAVSFEKRPGPFTGSYENLPVPEHEYFKSLTPDAGSRHVSGETAPHSADKGISPGADNVDADDTTPLRHGTAHRRPTVVHNEPRFKSREGLVAEYSAGANVTPSRASSVSEYSDSSPIESSTVQNATSVKYGFGHAKSMSAGSAKMLNIPPSRMSSKRTSPSASPAVTQTEF